ncbi:MAG TPA: NADP-dependent phosphogluconate dehydrogenase [Chitinophagaceae bacterium]|jgi:6-phosphogluconate dehydrogenase|nr:NADP-dependent phosphogluconate dehydrogenase [Chitinophagaceae bacterium]
MTGQYDFGMIGLGVMGSNLLLNMADHGYKTIGFDLKQERAEAFEAAARPGTTVKGVYRLEDLVAGLKKPRKIMMLVPAGKPVDDVLGSLKSLLEAGDIVIDGGNSYYRDTLRRVEASAAQGIHFMGMGVSGGELGARLGPSMMPGGDREAYHYLQPLLEAVAAKADGDVPCVAFMGIGAAGHYVKMVHNGIEYALMQLISEAYDLLHRGAGYSNEQLYLLFERWNRSELQSFLIEVTADVFHTKDEETDRYLVDLILDQAGSKGTGKWTSQEAANLPVAIPTIDAAVSARTLSVHKDLRTAAAGVYKVKGPGLDLQGEELEAHLEKALSFAFLISYAQGLHMLASASVELGMHIPLPDVIRVWKAGCIIRSVLLGTFSAAYEKNAELPNLLLDPQIAAFLKAREESTRIITAAALRSGVPVPCFASALTYYDGFRSERLPTNLIQAQRDYFGAHTYRRVDKEGVFHTEWHQDEE